MNLLDNFRFNLFQPLEDDLNKLSTEKGIYILCAIDKNNLPIDMQNLDYFCYNGFPVVYVGISGKQGIRDRDYKNHFRGSARNSTLRKSLGVLFGYDRVYYKDGKFKFIPEHEKELTIWMHKHLLLYYSIINKNLDAIEVNLINYFYPPLKLSKNKTLKNKNFRSYLSKLRNL